MKKLLPALLIFIILISILFTGISCNNTTGVHPKVLWYKINGLEWNEEKETVKFAIDPIEPEIDKLSSDELTQIVIDKWGSDFFSSAPLKEMIYLKDFPNGEAVREYLYIGGYENLGKNLAGFEVIR
jgi:hypothetical protein